MTPLPITTAPKDGRWLLLYYPVLGRWAVGCWCRPRDRDGHLYAAHWAIEGRVTYINKPTHYLPMPSIP